MNIKALIVAAGEPYKTFDCDISVPSLKIHTPIQNEIKEAMKVADYTNIIFTIAGEPCEVQVYKREDGALYANAREIAQMNLDRMEILKENTLVKKHIIQINTSNMNKKSFKPK